MEDKIFDILVIGGGINGAAIAAEGASRGFDMALAEAEDFGFGTSSRSSKLIHGGLRYLEYYDFRLVREALSERDKMIRKAGHIIWPLRFALPLVPEGRSTLILRTGLFLYDHLAPRGVLDGTRTLDTRQQPDNMGFTADISRAYVYSDSWVDDARMVIATLQYAEGKGARIMPHSRVTDACRVGNVWHATVAGAVTPVRARVIVNAAGPWAVKLSEKFGAVSTDYSARLVRGSHIVLPRLYVGEHATMLQLRDGRVVVTMPYEDEFTLIGTTDQFHEGPPEDVTITAAERDYLLAAANRFFTRKSTVEDIVWTYSGVRPLFEEGKARDNNPTTATREYSFKVDRGPNHEQPAFVTVLGGKFTTHRRLAEHALETLIPIIGGAPGASTTASDVLPGGHIPPGGPRAFAHTLAVMFPWLNARLVFRLARTYGDRVPDLIGDARSMEDMGILFGSDLTQREVEYLRECEWAGDADSILWRRTKCGLRMTRPQQDALRAYLGEGD